MTEEEARAWLAETFGARAVDRLGRFVELLLAEAAQQSLIARSTFGSVWSRHIADSAQLVPLAPDDDTWLDVGSGGGLPGVVAAILRPAPVVMIEPRRKRVEFLTTAIAALDLPNASVMQGNAQAYSGKAAIVSARAVSSIETVFAWTANNVSRATLFVLPRGLGASDDVEIARRAWHGRFHVEQSLTDPAAGIVIATDVRAR